MSIKFFVLLLSVFVLHACQIESARPEKMRKLVIVSDYLEAKDTILFKAFCSKTNTKLEIISMSPDRIIGTMRNKQQNSGIDILMIKSLYDVYKMDKRKLLHPINLSGEIDSTIHQYSSWKYHYAGFGIDPYIIAHDRKRNVVKTYDDLTHFDFTTDLSHSDLPPMLSPVLRKMNKAKANTWIKEFDKRMYTADEINDSTSRNLPVLTLLSNYRTNADSLFSFKTKKFLYPNERTTGTFYNVRTFCVVKQAENYVNAKEFILYYLQQSNNAKLNKALSTESVFETSSSFRRYSTPSEKLLPYYSLINRVLIKLN